MTSYESVSLVISVIGFIAVIVSLWLLNRQTGVFKRQLMESLAQSMTNYSLEISRLFLQHPDLRPYFFEGQVIDEGHPDYLRSEALAEVMLDIFWIMMAQAKRVRGREFRNEETRSQWATYMGDCFATSPILTSFLTRRQEWYGPELVSRMEQGLAHARQHAS